MDRIARQWDNPNLQPLRVLRLAGIVGGVSLIACLVTWLTRTRGWTHQDPRWFAWMGGIFAAVLAGMAAWIQWGIHRRRSSDGALFGRHSRIGTTVDNDVYVYVILAGAISCSASRLHLQAMPVVASITLTWLMFADIGIRRPFSSARLDVPISKCFEPLARSFLAVIGVMTLSFAPGLVLGSFGRGHIDWVRLVAGLLVLILAGSLAVYAANAHADDAWQAAQERGEPGEWIRGQRRAQSRPSATTARAGGLRAGR